MLRSNKMSPSVPPLEARAVAVPATNGPRSWTAGTLRYDQRQLVILFFWLMWNDFSVMLIESVTSLTQVLYQDNGASFTQMAMFTSLAGYLTMWINPWCSTWSDRFRSRWGRRRPFLFVAVPLFALGLVTLPYMPQIGRAAMGFAPVAGLVHGLGPSPRRCFSSASPACSPAFATRWSWRFSAIFISTWCPSR